MKKIPKCYSSLHAWTKEACVFRKRVKTDKQATIAFDFTKHKQPVIIPKSLDVADTSGRSVIKSSNGSTTFEEFMSQDVNHAT